MDHFDSYRSEVGPESADYAEVYPRSIRNGHGAHVDTGKHYGSESDG